MAPLKYKKTSGFATTHGQQYEINLAALLYLRGLNSGLDFQLGTNVKGAGAMDDVVFRFKPSGAADTWTTLYVQMKFKANKPIAKVMLTNKKGDFSVSKYFDSYLEIKEAMPRPEKDILFDGDFEKSAFVIFTNARVNEPLGKDCSETLSKAEDFVWCGSGNVFRFEEDEDILKCLGERGDEGKAFLGSFGMFCCQPDAKGLEAAIEKELSKVNSELIRGVDLDMLCGTLLDSVKDWWQGSNEVLDNGHGLLLQAVEKGRLVATAQQTKKDYNVDLDFEEAVLESLLVSVQGDCKVANVQSSESSCRLSLTKLCQAFGGQSLVLDCEGLLANQVALLAQWQKGDVKSLIICTNGWSSSHEVDYFSVVKDLLALRDTPPIVFVSNDKSCAVGAIAGEFQESVKSYKDDFLFSQLTGKSRDVVLSSRVSLQGQSTTLRGIVNGPPEEVDRVLDACSVVEILERAGNLTLGSAFGKGIDFYVDRHLELFTVVKASVFQDGALRGNVTVRVTQCETSTDLGLGNDRVGIPRVSATNNGTGLFEKAVSFLSSLDDAPSIRNVNTGEIVSNLSRSRLVADRGSPEVFIGPKFSLGLFECDSVGLRFGQLDAVTALRVRVSGHSTQAGFLFVSDKTSENDDEKLSDFHQSKHLLSLEEDGLLRWIQSDKDIESIRPHIDEKQVSEFTPENAMDVEDRLVPVCAEPGMGKSTLMARLAKNTKEAHPRHFVFLIALNDHSKLFAQDIHKDALGFLCSANKIESHLHRSLLKYALEVSGDVVVLLDGFDEIAPKYVEQSCALLTSLIEESKACKIWMTSRNSVKMTLEDKTLQFSMKLRKFIEVDQINFLKKYWAPNSALSAIELDDFIKQLIAKTSQAVRDKERDFMGIPLQTQMLAKVYEDHVTGSKAKTKLPDKMDLLELLEQFVDKKCGVYLQEKVNVSSDSPMYEELFKTLRQTFNTNHEKAALLLILGNDDIKILGLKSIITESSEFFKEIQDGSHKTGFIDSIVDGKPRFVHRVFAEYFVATWISKHFADNRDLVESKLFTADFSVVRNIFDRILARGCALHTAVLDEDLDQVRTLLGGEDGVVDAKDAGGRTALHLAASLGVSEDREENKRRDEILDLLIVKTSDVDKVDDVLGGFPIKYADVTRSWVAVDKLKPCAGNKDQLTLTLENVAEPGMLDTMLNAIYDSDLHSLLDFCLDNGLEVEHCSMYEDLDNEDCEYEDYKYEVSNGKCSLLSRACALGSLKVASLLIERNADIHAVNHKRQSPLYKASKNGRIEVVKLLLRNVQTLENASNQLTPTQTSVNCDGTTSLMLSARNDHQAGASYLLNNFNEEREDRYQQVSDRNRKDYINMRNKYGKTAIHVAARQGHSEVIGELIMNGGDPLSRAEDNITPLHWAAYRNRPNAVRVLLEALDEADRADAVNSRDKYGDSVLMMGARGGSVECVKLVVEAGRMMTQVNNDGRTPLMEAADRGYQEVVSYLLNNFNAEREGITLQNFINMRDKDGKTAIDIALCKGQSEVISELIRKGGDPLSRDKVNSTPLHSAARWNHPNAVRVLLEALDEADRADAVNSRDKYGDSVLMRGARGGSVECVELVVEAGGMMTQVDFYGRTPLMTAANGGRQEVVSYLFNNFDAEREGITLQDYINMGDEDGKTAIYFAAFEGHSEVISELKMKGGDPLSRDRNNRTPLHSAASRRQPNAVRVLLEALDEADRADAVNSRDNDGDSVLMRGAGGGSVECVDLIVEAGGMMTQVGNYERTPLMNAAMMGYEPVVAYLLSMFDPEREQMTNRAHINMVDKFGKTALALARPGCRATLQAFLADLVD